MHLQPWRTKQHPRDDTHVRLGILLIRRPGSVTAVSFANLVILEHAEGHSDDENHMTLEAHPNENHDFS